MRVGPNGDPCVVADTATPRTMAKTGNPGFRFR